MNFIYNSPIKFNIPNLRFKSTPLSTPVQNRHIVDGFSTNPLHDRLGDKTQLEMTALNNPRIQEILTEYNLPVKINIEELENLKQGHLKETRIIAAKIYSSLPDEMKSQVSLPHLQEAAMLHDYGKVLIPSSVLNKPGKLNEKERAIMELHSELGYELLKDKNLDDNTLRLIKYHHQTADGSGYPKINKTFEYGIDSQILAISDKYTALREKRSYKNQLGKYEALQILAKDVNDGKFSQEVYTALIKAVS